MHTSLCREKAWNGAKPISPGFEEQADLDRLVPEFYGDFTRNRLAQLGTGASRSGTALDFCFFSCQ
jgi:hypothetical protein